MSEHETRMREIDRLGMRAVRRAVLVLVVVMLHVLVAAYFAGTESPGALLAVVVSLLATWATGGRWMEKAKEDLMRA